LLEGKELYYKVAGDLPDYEFVASLNGAYYGLGNYICRKEKIVIGEDRKSMTFASPIRVDLKDPPEIYMYRYNTYSKSWEFKYARADSFSNWDAVSEIKSGNQMIFLKSLIGKNEGDGILEFQKLEGVVTGLPDIKNTLPENSKVYGEIKIKGGEQKLILLISGKSVDYNIVLKEPTNKNYVNDIDVRETNVGFVNNQNTIYILPKFRNTVNYLPESTAEEVKNIGIPPAVFEILHNSIIQGNQFYKIENAA